MIHCFDKAATVDCLSVEGRRIMGLMREATGPEGAEQCLADLVYDWAANLNTPAELPKRAATRLRGFVPRLTRAEAEQAGSDLLDDLLNNITFNAEANDPTLNPADFQKFCRELPSVILSHFTLGMIYGSQRSLRLLLEHFYEWGVVQ